MDIPYGTASIHIKNGESKRIPRNVSWETEGKAVCLEAGVGGHRIASVIEREHHGKR